VIPGPGHKPLDAARVRVYNGPMGLTKAQVLEQLARDGYHVTPKAFTKYREQELISEPRRVTSNKCSESAVDEIKRLKRGSDYLYSESVVDEIKRLIDIGRRAGARSLRIRQQTIEREDKLRAIRDWLDTDECNTERSRAFVSIDKYASDANALPKEIRALVDYPADPLVSDSQSVTRGETAYSLVDAVKAAAPKATQPFYETIAELLFTRSMSPFGSIKPSASQDNDDPTSRNDNRWSMSDDLRPNNILRTTPSDEAIERARLTIRTFYRLWPSVRVAIERGQMPPQFSDIFKAMLYVPDLEEKFVYSIPVSVAILAGMLTRGSWLATCICAIADCMSDNFDHIATVFMTAGEADRDESDLKPIVRSQ